MTRIVCVNEKRVDHDRVPGTNAYSSPDSDLKVAIVNEMEVDNDEQDYTVENFSYQAFNESPSSIPPLRKLPNSPSMFPSKNPLTTLRQFVTKIARQPLKVQLHSQWKNWPRLNIFLISMGFIVILLLLIFLSIQWNRLRYDKWLRTHQCVSHFCLTASGQLHGNLNVSVSPCDNFYQYACGNHFRLHHHSVVPDAPNAQGGEHYRSVIDEDVAVHFNREKWYRLVRIHRPAIDHLTDINIHTILMGLRHIAQSSRAKTNSAKYKVAQWYTSCVDRAHRNWVGERNFMRVAVNSLGGVWLLHHGATNESGAGDENSTINWPPLMFYDWTITKGLPLTSNWSWMGAIMRLQTDLHVPVFADFALSKEAGSEPQLLLLSEHGIWVYGGYFRSVKNYLIRLLQLLAIEAGIPYGDPEITERIKIAVNDVQIISQHLYRAFLGTTTDRKSVTLGELNERSSSFDWSGLLASYFNEVGVTFGRSYLVYSRNARFLKTISPLMDELEKNYTRPIFHRMLNNYMMCKIIAAYASHLSYDFVSITHRYYSSTDSNLEMDCFMHAHELFGTVLGALYVEQHLNEDAVNHTKSMLEYVKRSARDQIERTTWMDSETKSNLEKRIDLMKIKFDLPEIMKNDAKLDYAYRSLKTSSTYIDNLLSAVRFVRSLYNRILAGIADPAENEWIAQDVNVYDSKIGMQLILDELYVPLGALQPPVYHHTLPATLNFAGLGSMLGTAMAFLLDHPFRYNSDGSVHTHWTEQSWKAHQNHRDCVRNEIGNDTQRHLNLTAWLVGLLTNEFEDASLDVIDDATGLRIASRVSSPH